MWITEAVKLRGLRIVFVTCSSQDAPVSRQRSQVMAVSVHSDSTNVSNRLIHDFEHLVAGNRQSKLSID